MTIQYDLKEQERVYERWARYYDKIYLWLLAEFLGRRVVFALHPVDRIQGPSAGANINTVLLAMMVLGLALSLWPRRVAGNTRP